MSKADATIEHDSKDISKTAEQLFHQLAGKVEELKVEFLSGTGITWLNIIRDQQEERGYSPIPDPNDPNQLCITVMLAEIPPKGVDLPTEKVGAKGTYKVFTWVGGRVVFA